jgi:hypothetical protein
VARRRAGERGRWKEAVGEDFAARGDEDYVEEGPLFEGLDSFEPLEPSLFDPVESLEPEELLVSPEPLPEPSFDGSLPLDSLDSPEPLFRLPVRLSVR